MLGSFVKLAFALQIIFTSHLAAALTCTELLGTIKAEDALPSRPLQAAELARFAQEYSLQNKEHIIAELRRAQPQVDGRIYVKLLEKDNVTVWAHRWIGVATDIHDHVDSRAAIYVLRGSLREEFYQPPNPIPTTRLLEEGRAAGMGAIPYTHRVYGHGDAVSIHVYSPKLTNMSFYDHDPESGLLRINRRWHGEKPEPKPAATPQKRSGLNFIQPLENFSSRVEILPEPLAISSYAEIVGHKIFYTSTNEVIGKVYIIKPIASNVRDFSQHQGHLQNYKTEMNETNRNLFTFLGFEEAYEDGYGHYMSQVPDANLFSYLKNVYNQQVSEDLQIHVGVYDSPVVSAHQTEIVTQWLRHATVALGDPRFGSVLGTHANDLGNPVINGKEKLSTFRHDLEHFGSIVLIPKKIVHINQQVGQFWHKILVRIKTLDQQKKLPTNYYQGAEYREIMDAIYLYNRRFHSLTHVLGQLVRANGTIDINQQSILNFGQSAQSETPTVHWAGLGFKPANVSHDNLPFPNRLFDVSLENARTDRSLVSIADAYAMVTNDALLQARRFTHRFVRKFAYSPISGLLSWLTDFGINDGALLTEKELVALQNLTLSRHQQMGNSGAQK